MCGSFFAETLLRDYRDNCRALKERREYLSALMNPDLTEPRYSGGVQSSTVERWIIGLEDDDEAARLQSRVDAVESVMKVLSARERRFVILRYWERMPWKVVAHRLGVSVSHAKGAMRVKILRKFFWT